MAACNVRSQPFLVARCVRQYEHEQLGRQPKTNGDGTFKASTYNLRALRLANTTTLGCTTYTLESYCESLSIAKELIATAAPLANSKYQLPLTLNRRRGRRQIRQPRHKSLPIPAKTSLVLVDSTRPPPAQDSPKEVQESRKSASREGVHCNCSTSRGTGYATRGFTHSP
jgi:hypothetical protein